MGLGFTQTDAENEKLKKRRVRNDETDKAELDRCGGRYAVGGREAGGGTGKMKRKQKQDAEDALIVAQLKEKKRLKDEAEAKAIMKKAGNAPRRSPRIAAIEAPTMKEEPLEEKVDEKLREVLKESGGSMKLKKLRKKLTEMTKAEKGDVKVAVDSVVKAADDLETDGEVVTLKAKEKKPKKRKAEHNEDEGSSKKAKKKEKKEKKAK